LKCPRKLDLLFSNNPISDKDELKENVENLEENIRRGRRFSVLLDV